MKKMIIACEVFDHDLIIKNGKVCGQVFIHTETGEYFNDPFKAEEFAVELYRQNNN